MNVRWEVGSEFEWREDFLGAGAANQMLPPIHEFFSTGRSALFALIRLLVEEHGPIRVHLPSFFCAQVAFAIQRICEVRWYRDLPTRSEPDFQTLHPQPGDLVMAVNFFGQRGGDAWQDWISSNQKVMLLENHTHDPFSQWACKTNADYALASLRKTLPMPDGAILWSPKGLPLPKPIAEASVGACLKLSAMILKRLYLDGFDVVKAHYRGLQLRGEELLAQSRGSSASLFSRNVLTLLDLTRMKQQRHANVALFLRLISRADSCLFQPLAHPWPNHATPFCAVLLCRNQEIRDRLLAHMITENVYCTVHWRQSESERRSADPEAIAIANRIISIPTDFRYGSADIIKITDKVLSFSTPRKNHA